MRLLLLAAASTEWLSACTRHEQTFIIETQPSESNIIIIQLLEELTFAQLVKEFPTIYGNRTPETGLCVR
jgi:hypothetical protein